MDFDSKERENKYLRAKERVEDIKKFYSSLIYYLVFIIFLGALNYYTNEWRYMWFLWVAFGWGIGLVFQAIKAFRWNFMMGKGWEERKLKEFMDEEEEKDRFNK